jgi:RNA-directed DNA polymerase
MSGDVQVRFCERLGGRFPGATRLVCAFRFETDAKRFFRALSPRLAKFGLALAPEKSQVLRFSRFHPSKRRRATFLGFELFWFPDRQGTPQVTRRTARKRMHGAIRRISDWIKSHRHLPGRDFIMGLNRRLVGH